MLFMLTMTLKASAKATAEILAFVEGRADVVVQAIGPPVRVNQRTPRGLSSGRTVAEARGAEAHRQAPEGLSNPFVTQAVEQSTVVRLRAPHVHLGRNRVVYVLSSPVPDDVVVGVPARVMQLLSSHASGMSAKDIETTAGLKRKSVESALYHLRTIGAVQSVGVTS